MNRDILNVIVSKSDIRGVEEMAGMSVLMHSIIQQNSVYIHKSAIIKDINNKIKMSCAIEYKYIDLIELFISRDTTERNFSGLLHGASIYGHVDLVHYIIDKYALRSGAKDFNYGALGAAEVIK